ncbi:T9SS type A sorting domain-containing protein [Lacinutrix himadriensis]|uniref:T9SS type A sorting domain-containing protein n=1 Tax=Lacinutrix himadriensis TaxID=641549 RepID=UPI0006E373FD|nr:T9SS type A sorting domain-containing protein [Lacinutrix himadriensis]
MKTNYNFKKAILKSIRVFCVLLLFSYSAIAQNINFTINTAVDNGTSITETISVGGVNYILTIDHAINVESLDDLGGGDLIFYLGGSRSPLPFVLTITRDGVLANFDLIGIDYDTLALGNVGLTNQDDAVITSLAAYTAGSGALPITNTANALDISQLKIITGDPGDFNNFGFHNVNVNMVAACVPPAGTATFVSQDCGAGTFLAQVNVTDLGGGTPSIFDGTTTTAVTATGVYNFGPYPTGTPINFTLQHGTDTTCNVNLGAVADTCPPPCLPPVGTAILNSQDCVAGTFLIDVNVTDLGSGSPAIYDGTASTPITATGITTLGPYTAGTIIPITLLHGSDGTCNVDLGIVKDTCNEIIFTIDTAVDDGTNITETIVVGADTFVLTVDHSGSEALLGVVGDPSDLFFYHSTINPLDPFVLSVTRNGFPANFTLNGIDYDAAGTGSIYVRNQDDQDISAYTSYDAGSSGALNFTNVLNGVNISSFKIGTNNPDDLNLFGFHNISIDIEEGCVPPAGTATFVSQDCEAGTFLAQVNVTDLGGGTPSIFDGATTTPVTAIGVYDFGPYPTGTPVNFTLQHGADITCNVDLGAVTDTCPPPCSPPAGTAQLDTPFQDCDAGTFYAVINITDLGSGGSPILFDGTNSIPVTATGSFGIGTYPIGTPVTFTLQHGVDPTCDVVIGTVSNTCDEVIFTIDTAVDDDTLNIITETIVKDGDTYVLTVAHSGDEDLEELPGLPGDYAFFHSFGDPLSPHVLSITRNGFPTNFTLKGLDYDTLNAGTILVTNQDDLEISSPTSYPVGAGAIPITSAVNATNISSFNISAPVSGELNSFGFHNIKVDIIDTCAAGAATATLGTLDCANSDFYVDVNVTDLGNGSPVIFDGVTSTVVTTTGNYELGPYASGTSINFTLQQGSDVACDVDLGAVTYTCPAPANDLCGGAIAIACGETVIGSTTNATDTGNNPSNDVYYSFMSATLTDVNLSLCGSDYDTAFRVFDDCLQSNLIAFNDDSEACSGNQSVLTFTAQPNITYFIMIEGYDDDSGDYEMVVDCITSVPSPGNDLCANPTSLNLGVTLTGQTTAGATDSTVGEDDDTECDSYTFKADVWYTFQGPASGQATIATVITDTSDEANVAVYSSLDCSQLDVDIIACSAYNGGETVALTGLVPAATYYVRVWSDGVAGPPVPPITSGRFEGGFSITVTDSTLSIPGIEDEQLFSYYPNPVKGLLNITAKKEMSKITVFNMLGQTVLTEIPNTTTRSLDMSNLQIGAYFVKVTIGNVTKTIRVIKE